MPFVDDVLLGSYDVGDRVLIGNEFGTRKWVDDITLMFVGCTVQAVRLEMLDLGPPLSEP